MRQQKSAANVDDYLAESCVPIDTNAVEFWIRIRI